MRINRRVRGTVADRPIDTVVTQPVPVENIRRDRPSTMMDAIERIAARLNSSEPIESDVLLADAPAYDKG